MKRIKLLFLFSLISVLAFAGSPVKMQSGDKSFLKEDAKACVVMNYDKTTWDKGKTLKEELNDKYDKYLQNGQKAFIEAFNAKSSKLKITEKKEEAKYKIIVNFTNFDKFYSVMSFVPGFKTKMWADITIVEVASNKVVCTASVEELEGSRDFTLDDSWTKCYEELGKSLPKLK